PTLFRSEVPGDLPPGTRRDTMRAAALLLGLLCALGLAPGEARAEEVFGVNLLENGDFELGTAAPAGWRAVGAHQAGRDSRVARRGNDSGRLSTGCVEGEAYVRQAVRL